MEDKVNMANPCFYINYKFAELFLRDFEIIETTSDNFIHRSLIRRYIVKNYSMYPFPVTSFPMVRKIIFLNQVLIPMKV